VPAGGDVIVAVDGKSVSDSNEVANAIAQKRPGEKAEITYHRGDSKKTVSVELAKRPNSADQPSADQGGGGGGVLP
jgi:S1-C subfamily serine protease